MPRFIPSLIIVILAFAQSFAGASPVEFRVKKITDARGVIRIALFANAQAWADEKPTSEIKMPVTMGSSKMQIELPAGDYAFFLYQDLYSENKLRTTFAGYPNEPYAFSNDVVLEYHKPSFTELKFTVRESGATQVIHLVQP